MSKNLCLDCKISFNIAIETQEFRNYGNPLVVMVTGGRNYSDSRRVHAELDFIHEREGIKKLIVGDARGLDYLAYEWAKLRCVPYKVFKAEWDKHGKAAGHIRNSRMIKRNPDICLSFPGGKGTADATNKAEKQGIKTYYIV